MDTMHKDAKEFCDRSVRAPTKQKLNADLRINAQNVEEIGRIARIDEREVENTSGWRINALTASTVKVLPKAHRRRVIILLDACTV